MTALTALCGGFLLAVLWFDLMFDVQVLGLPPGPLPEEVLSSIAGYYRRVTTTANPMGRLVGVFMLILLAGTLRQLIRRSIPRPLSIAALVFAVPPIVLAMTRIVPNAIRLGERVDPVAVQSALARSICYEHLACIASIAVFCAIQLGAAWTVKRATSAGS
jgi:hypothetical protein